MGPMLLLLLAVLQAPGPLTVSAPVSLTTVSYTHLTLPTILLV